MLASDEALRNAVAEDDTVEVPPAELQAVWPITGDPALDRVPARPTAPLSASDLLVNARGEPALAHALGSEILSADSIDLLCAFVRWHGLRVLEEPLKAARRPFACVSSPPCHGFQRAVSWPARLSRCVALADAGVDP